MSRFDDIWPDGSQEDDLLLAERLERERPVPAPAFRGDLRRRLLARGPASSRPAKLRFRIAVALATGFILLGLVGVGVAGTGPFAAPAAVQLISR